MSDTTLTRSEQKELDHQQTKLESDLHLEWYTQEAEKVAKLTKKLGRIRALLEAGEYNNALTLLNDK